jgi:threonine/homoserine/homoserine lactone efflux protein
VPKTTSHWAAYGLLLVLLVHFLAERLRANPRISRTLSKLAGVFLIGFGVKLAVALIGADELSATAASRSNVIH